MQWLRLVVLTHVYVTHTGVMAICNRSQLINSIVFLVSVA